MPGLRISFLKIVMHSADRCPCGWDVCRVLGILPCVAAGLAGDGATAGAREICEAALRYLCVECSENYAYVVRIQRRYSETQSRRAAQHRSE